jgi:hypothetical protein
LLRSLGGGEGTATAGLMSEMFSGPTGAVGSLNSESNSELGERPAALRDRRSRHRFGPGDRRVAGATGTGAPGGLLLADVRLACSRRLGLARHSGRLQGSRSLARSFSPPLTPFPGRTGRSPAALLGRRSLGCAGFATGWAFTGSPRAWAEACSPRASRVRPLLRSPRPRRPLSSIEKALARASRPGASASWEG